MAPILTKVYKESFDIGQIPDTLNEALITLILKKDRDHTDSGSYRPISFIDVDGKNLTKVLATKIEKYMLYIVHADQVGFVKGHSSSDNVRQLLHLIWASRDAVTPTAELPLDAESVR